MGARDEEAATLLSQLGIPRPAARALVFLASVDEATSTQIEKATGMRQPEVSIAMRHLSERAWVARRVQRRETKGRPVHCYKLTIRLDDVVATIEREKRAEATANDRAIERLRALSDTKSI